ncbi:hypothetical protein LCGC14_1366690 [marine sediment metagenome]|uniref:7-cyano-7-deazaguanine synthase n=1 Tax=marine sediment metagenome TaxID=412755 RepID=A0A0F9MLT3_9ZZZZ
MTRALVLLSGGLDSCTLLGYAISSGYDVECISFQYGSKHQSCESQAALNIVRHYVIADRHRFVHVPNIFENSGLIDSELPMGRKIEDMQGIAPSYVPMRNTVLLGIAGSIADANDIPVVMYGAHIEDHVGYPDCRPEWVAAMSSAMMLGSKNRVRIEAPWIWKHKDDIIKLAVVLGAPLHLTYSCYSGGLFPCGKCDTCIIRIKAFKDAGYIDPVPYSTQVAINWDTHLGVFPKPVAKST